MHYGTPHRLLLGVRRHEFRHVKHSILPLYYDHTISVPTDSPTLTQKNWVLKSLIYRRPSASFWVSLEATRASSLLLVVMGHPHNEEFWMTKTKTPSKGSNNSIRCQKSILSFFTSYRTSIFNSDFLKYSSACEMYLKKFESKSLQYDL